MGRRCETILCRWAILRVTRWIPRCSMASSHIMWFAFQTETKRLMRSIGSSRIGNSTPMGGKPRTWRKRGGTTPSNARMPVRRNSKWDQSGGGDGKARGPFLSIVATTSLAARERTGKAGVRARRGRGVLVGRCRLGPLDSRLLLAFICHCLNCSGTRAQVPRRGYRLVTVDRHHPSAPAELFPPSSSPHPTICCPYRIRHIFSRSIFQSLPFSQLPHSFNASNETFIVQGR